jgi:hypothetical protein
VGLTGTTVGAAVAGGADDGSDVDFEGTGVGTAATVTAGDADGSEVQPATNARKITQSDKTRQLIGPLDRNILTPKKV